MYRGVLLVVGCFEEFFDVCADYWILLDEDHYSILTCWRAPPLIEGSLESVGFN